MSGLNIQRIRDIFDSVYDSAAGVLKTSGSGGGGSSSITSNSSIAYNIGAADAKTTRVVIASDQTGIPLLQAQTALTQLTAPSSSAAVSMAGYNHAVVSILAASINTNVVVRVEVSNDGTNWDNASATNTDTTLTSATPYRMFFLVGCPHYIRVTFVSESGGTTATIDAIVRLSA